MAYKYLARIEARTLECDAHDLAIVMATAMEIEADDDGGDLFLCPFDAVKHEDDVTAVRVMLARPLGPLLVLNIVPDAVNVCKATERARLRDAVIAALGRYCRVARPSWSPRSASRSARRHACCTEEGSIHALSNGSGAGALSQALLGRSAGQPRAPRPAGLARSGVGVAIADR